MTITEYEKLLTAHNLKLVDKERDIHETAWLTFAAQAKKKAGKNKEKPVYRTFKSFFDYEKEIEKVTKKKESRFARLSKFIQRERGEM